MHYLTVAIMPDSVRSFDEAQAAIDGVMAPHRESYDEETDELTGVWDWFQVGGRWTGHYSEYDPENDPANADPQRGYPGRNGLKIKWPTSWKKFEGDLVPVRHILNGSRQLPDCHLPVYVFLPDGRVVGHWKEEERGNIEGALEQVADKLALVVDIHD